MDRQIPIAHLRERYTYDPETGDICHKKGSAKAPAGSVAGSIRKDGYRVIKVTFGGQRVQVMAHVMAWAMFYGRWPENDVDHRDTNRLNNRIANLRDGTRSQNLANRNKVGVLPKGVTFNKRFKSKPYMAQLKHNGTNYYLGCHASAAEAAAAYAAKAQEVYGEFMRI